MCVGAPQRHSTKLGSEASLPGLLKALEHSESSVRRSAAEALGKLGSEASLPGLLKVLEDPASYVRRSAVEALGKLGSEASIPGLLKALEDPESDVRRSATDMLIKLEVNLAVPPLLKALDDPDNGVRRRAARGLGQLGTEKIIGAIIKKLQYRGPQSRQLAAEILGAILSRTHVSKLKKALVISNLVNALTDTYSFVRYETSQALRKISAPQSLIQLQQLRIKTFNAEIDETISGIQEACQFYNYPLTQPLKEKQSKPMRVPHQIDFAILTAIEPERQALCTALNITDNVCQGHGGAKRIRKANRTYWHTTLPLPNGQHYSLILAQAPDMANVDAALLAADTLNHWQPHAILMVGIAAATSRHQTLGDIILGKDLYYYDRGNVTPEGILPEPVMYRPDATLWDRAITTPKADFPIQSTRPDGTDTFPTITPGVIASGEKVIADADVRDALVAQHRKIKAIEMEGYGVHAAAHQRHEPTRCLVIRSLCDYADGEKNDTWHQYAAAAAAGFTKHFLLDRPLEPRNK